MFNCTDSKKLDFSPNAPHKAKFIIIVTLAASKCGTPFIPATDLVRQFSQYMKKYHHLHPPQTVVDLQSKLLSGTERRQEGHGEYQIQKNKCRRQLFCSQ